MIYTSVPGDYIDIDGYASALAYAELLNQRSKPAQSFLAGPINYSVPESLRIPELENYHLELTPEDEFIVLDLSIPEVIAKHIPEKQIIELIDHHVGFEEYWHEKLGDKSIIEKIGAVATSVFEWWGECWDYEKMSPSIAKLLLAAILDNTLNFNAAITTERDKIAAQKLSEIIGVPVEEFADWYFSTVSETIIGDLDSSIRRDHKFFHIPKLDLDVDCAQITIWDGNHIKNQAKKIADVMNTMSENWVCSVVSISDRKNYILTSNPEVGTYLSEVLDLKPDGEWYISDRLWLRKEIFAKLLNA